MKTIRKSFFILLTFALWFSSCTTINLFEKDVTIPGHEWKSSFKPDFTFAIKDTTAPYQFFFVIRHTEKYNYTNVYINLYIKAPHSDSATKIQRSLTLADNNGWLGSGMDDIYEQRIPLGAPQSLKAGTYTFTLEQIMREDPLKNVLNVGLRIEKK